MVKHMLMKVEMEKYSQARAGSSVGTGGECKNNITTANLFLINLLL